MTVNLAAVDLKLLVVFDAVMAERNVTRAARRLGMSQPAVSNALGRVRYLMKDELFTRTADGMQPTPRAFEISTPVHVAMRKLEETLEPPYFEGGTTEWTFKVGVSDHASIVFLPTLLKRLAQVGPNIKLNINPKPNDMVASLLITGELDFVIGIIPPLSRRFGRNSLFEDQYICVMDKTHPFARGSFSMNDYAAARHLELRPSQSRMSAVDGFALEAGVHRNISIAVNQFVAVPSLIRGSPLIASLLKRLAGHLDLTGLTLRPVPLPKTRVQISAVWNKRLANHPAHRWLRTQVAEVSRQMEAEGA